MSGVEILAMEEVAIVFGFSWFVFWAAFIFTTIISTIVSGLSFFQDIGWYSLVVGLIGGCALGAFVGLGSAREQLPLEYETHYKVTILEEVSMNDFLERYEILDQEGKIYTVREVGVKDGK